MSMQAIRNILFDLDGTLVNSPIDFAGIKSALGISPDTDILGFLESLRPTESEAYQKASQIIYDFEFEASKKTVLYEGVEEFLEYLSAESIQMGIVTRNCREVAHEQIKSVSGHFLKILTRDDVSNPKPHPESFEFFHRNFDFLASETLFIGNHYHDYQFAENNRMRYLEFVPMLEQTKREFEFLSYFDLKENFIAQTPKVF